MSLPRPSGLKAPSKIGKPSGLPQPKSLEPDDIPPPADDFIIGDRVWVGGTKPGFIAFLGETQFGTGEWAGIVLDNFEGKNDGSVQGVRYFQCEPKRGIFARISKLSRTPDTLKTITPKPDDVSSEHGGNSVRNGSSNAKRGSIPHIRPTTPKTGLAPTHRNLSTSSSSLHKASTPTQKPGFRLGDRVLVSGTKTGTLRYLGATDFAKGDWAGVELDEKQGKNDGAVAGKRYFECRPMFGLFAPVHKVAKLDVGTVASTPSPQTRSLMNTSLRLSRERSGSQESVSSISSTASSVSRSRVRLGVTSLGNQQKKSPVTRQSPALLQAKNSQRPSTLNLSATTSALQKALKEKEEHIEQLLKERDLERAEVARAAAQVDEAEGQLMNLRTENERAKEDQDELITKLQRSIQELEKEKADLNCKLDDEKRKVEDLQFQIEEEAITKDDIEIRTEADGAKFREIEKAAKKEKDRADKFEQELITLQIQLKEKSERLNSTEDTNMTYLDQIEELTHKLSQAENKIRVYDSSRLEEGAKTSQVSMELAEKSARVTELEDILSTRNREIKNLQNRLGEVEEEMKSSTSSKEKMQQTIDRMTSDLNKGNDTSNQLRSEIQQMQTQLSELRRQLNSSKERTEQLTEEKNQLEQQMSEMMKNSGDSSQKLSILNEQVKDKTRKIEDLQADLSSSTQKWEKLNEEIAEVKRQKENELQGLKTKHDDIAKTIHNQLEDVQIKLDKANNKMRAMTEDFDKEKEDAISRKLSEINDLKKQLQQSKDELEKQEVQTQAHKQVLDKITMEKDALQFEKEKTEKLVKRLEGEKETLNTDLIHARVEMTKIKNDSEQIFGDKDKLNEQIQDLKAEVERILKVKTEVVKDKEETEAQKDLIMTERDNIQREVVKIRAEFQKKDIEMEESMKEVEKLRQENVHLNQSLSLMSQQESSNEVLNQQLENSKKTLADLQSRLNTVESERDSMKAQLEFTNLITEERKRLEDQNHLLSKEIEELAERHRKEIEGLSASKDTLQNEVDNYTELLRQRSEELEEKKKQISNLKNDSSSLELYRNSVQKLEKERIELQDKINTLEKAVSESAVPKHNNNNIDISLSGNSPAAKLKEEKESAQRQVDFLNSVIVDLQKKNNDLQTRLEVMESGVVTNGDADSSMENTTSSKRAPPRLFCDICDVFDKHDTDDCPLQAMDYDETPPPSQHHGDRKQMRPYCDICEVFGHWTDDCDDEQTF